MTGGQKVPDLRKVIEAIVPDVSVFDMDGRKEKNRHPAQNFLTL